MVTGDRKAVLILNPAAGSVDPDESPRRIERAFLKCGMSPEIVMTNKRGDGREIARSAAEDGVDLVIAGGGDGTVNEVINGIAETRTKLGILPVGTVNVLARELRIPINPHKAIRTIVQGKVRNIDLGCANGHWFSLMAGFGFDAEVVGHVVQPLKDIIGSSAYVLKGLETLASYQPTDVTLEMREDTYVGKAYLVIVANSPTYAYRLQIAPYATQDDGLLDVLVFEQPVSKRLGFIRQILEVFIRRHVYHRDVRYFKTSKVTVRSDPDVMVQLDGDSFGTTPVEITIATRTLPVMVPR